MTAAETLRDILKADSTLVSVLTGGIYVIREAGRLGLDRTSLPAAYSPTTKKLLPCLLIHSRDFVPRSQLNTQGYYSGEIGDVVVEFYFYVDGDDSPAPIFTARNIVYGLLHRKRFSGIMMCEKVLDIEDAGKAIELTSADMIRTDYSVREIRRYV